MLCQEQNKQQVKPHRRRGCLVAAERKQKKKQQKNIFPFNLSFSFFRQDIATKKLRQLNPNSSRCRKAISDVGIDYSGGGGGKEALTSVTSEENWQQPNKADSSLDQQKNRQGGEDLTADHSGTA